MPTYTYRCDAGHTWEEVGRPAEGSETSEEPCRTCLANLDRQGLDIGSDLSDFAGHRVPSSPSVILRGPGFTPIHYPGRDHK